MKQMRRRLSALTGLLLGLLFTTTALAQKQGGILRVFHRDSPASMSILEEGSISVIMPMMGVFNNLVLFDQHVPQNRVETIVPDLATSWTSNEEGTELTFTLRESNGTTASRSRLPTLHAPTICSPERPRRSCV